VWKFLKKLKTELPSDPVIPLLEVYLTRLSLYLQLLLHAGLKLRAEQEVLCFFLGSQATAVKYTNTLANQQFE
jgi:hypothetical protein